MTAPYMFVFRSPGIMPFVAARTAPETGRSGEGLQYNFGKQPVPTYA